MPDKIKYHITAPQSMNKQIMTGSLVAIVALGSLGLGVNAFAQYLGNVGDQGETGVKTLEEALALQRSRIDAVMANPGAGSGTPYLSADSVVGATAISAAIFGGIAATFFIKARTGKYAAMGRG